MADNPQDGRFEDGFLDDFFAESDEHLSAVRRNLLSIEASLHSGNVPRGTFDEMYRSFHTLKGISGMVGFADAELLAHDMESYLRALKDGGVTLTEAGVEALIDGTRLFEEVISARRHGSPSPDVDPVRRLLLRLVPPRGAASDVTAPASGTRSADSVVSARGPVAWRVTFAPSADLVARGVNVNAVRERLRSTGEIHDARPIITSSGGIAFQFTVLATAGATAFERWKDDGISAELVEAPGAPPVPREDTAVVEEAAPRRTARPAGIVSQVVRVDLGRLDEVMQIVADIVVTRSRFEETLERSRSRLTQADFRALQDANDTLERQLRTLREGVTRLRLVPVREIFSRMPFVVRDLGRDNGKQVRLELHGQETEIDKFLVERMMDPILHLVRNAVSHGIESPAEREAAGKPPVGTIHLRASSAGDMVLIEVEDDGRGIDPDVVLERARQLGVAVPAVADASGLLEVLCAADFSTRNEADRASGRGIGMGVVKEAVEQMSGTLEMDTEPGRFTRFVMNVPLTLAIIDALVCSVGDQRFAVPQTAVREVVEVDPREIRALERNEVFPYRDGVLPIIRVADLLHVEQAPGRERVHVFVVGTGAQAVALAVDRILGQREIVVRGLIDPLVRVEGLAGATELGDPRPVLILDPLALVRLARKRNVEAS